MISLEGGPDFALLHADILMTLKTQQNTVSPDGIRLSGVYYTQTWIYRRDVLAF